MNRAQHLTIVGVFLLFLFLVALFMLDPEYAGRATAGSRANITNSSSANCTVTGIAGLNLVSLACLPTAIPLSQVVNGSDVWAMYQYAPGSSDPWKVHNPNLPSYVVSDLTFLSRRVGYALVLNATRTFRYEGLNVTTTNVPLVQGWNLVGYPAFVTKDVATSLESIDNYTEVRAYNASAGTYTSHVNPSGGALTQIVPAEGYWINATQGTTWVVSS